MATAGSYPANDFALDHVLDVCREQGFTRILEIGVGHGKAVPVLAAAGLEITGLDRNPEMVEVSRAAMVAAGQDPDRIILGDFEDPAVVAAVVEQGPFDAVLGLGILPTALDEDGVWRSVNALLRPDGRAFMEYRNVLFSLVTFNRHTRDFILDDLLVHVSPAMRQAAAEFIEPRLNVDVPPRPTSPNPPRYHNPLTIPAAVERVGLADATPVYFHYHPAPPALEAVDPELFHADAKALEHEDSGWKGMFLCSVFLLDARRTSD